MEKQIKSLTAQNEAMEKRLKEMEKKMEHLTKEKKSG